MLASQADYKLAFEYLGYKFYEPVNIATGYHDSRYVEAFHNEIYANSGATSDVLKEVCTEMIALCNIELKSATLRTDIAALANSLLYRLKFPIDQDCAIRQGAILTFCEYTAEDGSIVTENPNKVEHHWITKKIALAKDHPEVYSFFLQTGVSSMREYSEASNILEDGDYFQKRAEAIKSLTPQSEEFK